MGKAKKYYLSLLAVFLSTFITACSSTVSNQTTLVNKNDEIATEVDSSTDNKEFKVETIVTEEVEENSDEKSDLETTEAKVHFINTGNSDAILIVQGDKSVLVDSGDNDDEGLVTIYIKNLGVTYITYLISTHPDADHSGGLDAVINNFDIGQFFVGNGSADTKTYTDVLEAAANKGINPSVPLEDSIFNLTDNSYIQFFNTIGGKNSNESSLITLFVNGNDKFLLTGDAGIETENKIISKLQEVNVLKIGHHGSKESTSQSLIDKVSPEYAVILTGKNNYGHPTSEVLNKLEASAIELHRTDECGDIVFSSTGSGVTTECLAGSFTAGEKNSTEQSSSNTSSSVDSGESNSEKPTEVPAETPTGKMVWLSATGEKYHSINNCGRMNPDKATQVTLEAAQAKGMSACTKCN